MGRVVMPVHASSSYADVSTTLAACENRSRSRIERQLPVTRPSSAGEDRVRKATNGYWLPALAAFWAASGSASSDQRMARVPVNAMGDGNADCPHCGGSSTPSVPNSAARCPLEHLVVRRTQRSPGAIIDCPRASEGEPGWHDEEADRRF
jgi:hypothetical protein